MHKVCTLLATDISPIRRSIKEKLLTARLHLVNRCVKGAKIHIKVFNRG